MRNFFLIKQLFLLRDKKFNITEYHLVKTSPWPLLVRLITRNLLLNRVFWIYLLSKWEIFLLITILNLLLCLTWWRDVNRESLTEGEHSLLVYNFIVTGMLLFIVREVFFFLSFFWAYFNYSQIAARTTTSIFPPEDWVLFIPETSPLLNSILLLRSGITLTYRHYILHNLRDNKIKFWLFITILLGIIFTFIQYSEYNISVNTIRDARFGSTFFVTTGFHGLHVIIGSLFLAAILIRVSLRHINSEQNRGFNNRAWYWHFVDVVWLALYIIFYWISIY